MGQFAHVSQGFHSPQVVVQVVQQTAEVALVVAVLQLFWMLKELVKQLEVSDVVHILELRGGWESKVGEKRGEGREGERVMGEQKMRGRGQRAGVE